jgi:hypothetical protein
MKRLLFVFVLVLACVIGLGFYRGWFHIGSDRNDNQDHLTITVDEARIKDDSKKAQQKVQDLRNSEKDKAVGTPEKTEQ